uniref:Torsin-1A C-terminal domain-containing protein n=1 Tax=Leptobrachium leishanense TaxID=445787 RepID=A0A8C5RB05_9ANUR
MRILPRFWIVLLCLIFGPITSSTAHGFFQGFSCYFMKCCGEEKAFSAADLKSDLDKKLFGQHLARDTVLRAVTRFMKNPDPEKPLVLSFYGGTGVGKSFITKVIADNVYTDGINSMSVRLFSSQHHFPHVDKVALYKDQLKSQIQEIVSRCARSMIIFDEVDKLHPGILDVIKAYLDYNANIDGVSYRKVIFIFISNTEGEIINRKMLHFMNAGKNREDLCLYDFEKELSDQAFSNKKGGFWHSDLIARGMIGLHVPFLPLEFRHVKMCVQAELNKRGLGNDEELAIKIAHKLCYLSTDREGQQYGARTNELRDLSEESNIFSKKGCKLVTTELDMDT